MDKLIIIFLSKIINWAIFTKVGFSLISLLPLALATKGHTSDVEITYIPIFKMIKAVYPVGVSKNCLCFIQTIDYNIQDLVWILTKINAYICL